MTSSYIRGPGGSFVDLDRGIFYRLAEGRRATKKRQSPTPLPPRLLAHVRRWACLWTVNDYFVEWNGKPVCSIKVGYKRAIALAGLLGKITPRTLRHTRNLAHAEGRTCLGGRWLPRDVAGNG